jgi:hypothetical protein
LAVTPDVVYTVLSLADPDSPLVRGFSIAGGVVRDVPVIIHADANQK